MSGNFEIASALVNTGQHCSIGLKVWFFVSLKPTLNHKAEFTWTIREMQVEYRVHVQNICKFHWHSGAGLSFFKENPPARLFLTPTSAPFHFIGHSDTFSDFQASKTHTVD